MSPNDLDTPISDDFLLLHLTPCLDLFPCATSVTENVEIVENSVSGLKGGLTVSRWYYWDMPENKVISSKARQTLANAALSQLS